MTDDLVKRLRERQEFEFIDGHKRVEWEDEDALIAADRIEELEAALHDVTDAWDSWQSQETRNGFSELFANICEARAALGGK